MIVNKPKKKKEPSRYATFFIIMGIIFTAIVLKLIYIQIFKHDDYTDKANTTSTKFISEKAPRGIIYDQDGNILASNTQTYTMTYTSTSDADKVIYTTIDKVVKILKDNGKDLEDDLILKIDDKGEPYFKFKSTSPSGQRVEELRFKKDRGLDEKVKKELFGNNIEDLSDEQIEEVNEALLKISPRDVFYDLVKSYNIINVLNPTDEAKKEYADLSGEELTDILSSTYNYDQIREYILVKDTIKMQSFKGYRSITLASNISKDIAFILMQKLNELPGISVTLEPSRYYPYNELASSVIGYLSSIDAGNAEKYELRGYDVSSDIIGMSGIESAFEDQLRGVKGGTTVKVNSKGRVTEELFKLESYPGNNVHLTIDKDIQYAAEQSLKDIMETVHTKSDAGVTYNTANRGAVVAVEVNTGRILASASYPNYNPNEFTTGKLSDELITKYFAPDYEGYADYLIKTKGLKKTVDDLFPLSKEGLRSDPYDLYPRSFYNYATQGLIPPGSTFKPLTGIAGLEEGVVGPDETIYDRGVFNVHPETYGSSFAPECLIYSNYGGSHGAVDVSNALEVSCNYYFYEVAYRLYKKGGSNIEALNKIAEYAYKFGLGVDPNGEQRPSTGIEIEENFGQVYNFQSFKNQSILYSRFELRDYLESGDYRGIYSFVPFDYSANEFDSEILQNAKESLKNQITEAFNKVGTSEELKSTDVFAKKLLPDIKTIMASSDVYKQNVANYESEGKGTVNTDKQAQIIANTIARFVISDKGNEIKSPAQEVYAAIGQGMNTFTPMQLAQYISTIANGGTRYALHYVDKITSPDGDVIQEYEPTILDKIDLHPSTVAAIVDGMRKVNNDENGTAITAWQGFPIETAGKTGTADFSEKQNEVGRAPFATYVSFAPTEKPQIAVVAVLYDGGHGGYIAPVARAVYEAYFKDELLQLDPNYAAKSQSFQKYIVGGLQDNKVS